MSDKELTQTRLMELLEYNSETGLFKRLVTTSSRSLKGAIIGKKEKNLYPQIMVDSKKYTAHRLAWLYVTGEWPKHIDHINHIKSDNRWVNLRNVTSKENQKNLSLAKNNTSGVLGVSWAKQANKWLACIKIKGKTKNLGYFSDINKAKEAREKANLEFGFHNNHGLGGLS